MKRNPLITPEYRKALFAFHKAHPGALDPVIGSLKDKQREKKKRQKQLTQRKPFGGRKDAGGPVRTYAENNAGPRSDDRGNTTGLAVERSRGTSTSGNDGATKSRAPEAAAMSVAGDR